jgi:hypothetical protein
MCDEPRETDDESVDGRWARSLAAVRGFRSGTGDLSQNHDEEFAAASEE